MKQISKLLFFAVLLSVIVWSCEKDENKIYYEGGTAPVLTSSVSTIIPLSFVNADKQAIKLSWTNPEYRFSTGTSSHDVTYQIEIDTVGANFTNPNKKTIAVSKELTWSATQSEFNDFLLNQLVLKPGMPHSIEMRVVSNLANGSAALTSNLLKYTVTPYAIPPKVAPPASGKLFIVGNATPGGWNNPVPVPTQEFTKLSETMFEITVALTGGNSYLLLPVNGDWGVKYGAMGANHSNNTESDDFKMNGGDLLAPAASGNYKIVVDFQRGKFTVTKL